MYLTQRNKRKRSEHSYKEESTSSFSDDSDEGNITLAKKWTNGLTKLMHIIVKSEHIFEEADDVDDEQYLPSITDDMWEAKIDIRSLPIKPIFKTLVKEVKDVHDARSRLYETYINDYVDTLLHNMHFHSYPLHINAQRRYEIKIKNDSITVVAIPDFVVTSYESKMMIIIEDRTMHNASYGNRWKEDQVIAEIFVAAHSLKITDAQDFYAVHHRYAVHIL
ncbi:hypothetical protein DM01DRAFT_1196872 [Hesseltinella vesiculosa]|uniref:Uncharacterized protein n=1 Tax=Hesseltinella vesiculosa TaxID=101127 RepID=A0A1X2G4H1_9FUNG|nr:hypothetical protein DM01DRAFT_1196872 [Hesseltinella vesiculosa]